MTADLVQFLRARLADDRAVAHEAALQRSKYAAWRAKETDVYTTEVIISGDAFHVADTGATYPGAEGYDEDAARAEHIARHDPARVLAEVDAKRQIVDGVAGADPHGAYITGTFTAWDALRLLALPYADHPDYREEWTP